jgi:hypothetical protein
MHLWPWAMFFLEQFNYANFIRSAFSAKNIAFAYGKNEENLFQWLPVRLPV